jgi:hypothetical protein
MKFGLVGAIFLVSAAAVPAGASGAKATASPSTNLGSDQIVTVTWSGFTKLAAGHHTLSIIECLGTFPGNNFSDACDNTGKHEVNIKRPPAKGSAQIDIASGPMYDPEGHVNGYCGTTTANNNCMIVVAEFGGLSGAEWHQVEIPISFALPG